jgi:hypothetical protein
MISCISPLENNYFLTMEIFVDLHDGRTTHKDELMFWDQGQTRLCKIKKIMDRGIRINDDNS